MESKMCLTVPTARFMALGLAAACGGAGGGGGPGGGEACVEALELPRPAGGECPAGWTATAGGGACASALGCACPSGTMPQLGSAACVAVGWPAPCPDGWRRDAADEGCEPVLPEAPCAAGTMRRIGRAECVPVGWTQPCPEGFAADPSGWGCRAVLPAAPCAGATRERLGDAACAPVGECGEGRWGGIAPGGAVVFVDGGEAGQGGDGTQARPFRTIAAASRAAGDGALVAIAAGTYREPLVVDGRSLRIAGVCAARVVLEGDGRAAGVTLRGAAAHAELSGLTVRGWVPGIRVEGGARLTLRDAVVEANHATGLLLEDAATTVSLHAVVVRDTAPHPITRADGFGIVVRGGARLALADTTLRGNHRAGLVVAREGSTADVQGCVVAATRPEEATALPGHGMQAERGATLTVARTAVFANEGSGIEAGGAGTSLHVEESVIGGAGPDGDRRNLGLGLSIEGGARLEVERSVVAGHRVAGVHLKGGASARLGSCVVRDTTPQADGQFGRGVGVGPGGHLEMAGCALLDNTEAGLAVLGDGSSARLDASLVLGTRPAPASAGVRAGFGPGWGVVDGATLVVRSSEVAGSAGIGAFVTGAGSRLEVEDGIVRDTVIEVAPEGHFRGEVVAYDGGALVLRRSLVEKAAGRGIGVEGAGATAEVGSCVIRSVAAGEASDVGIAAWNGAHVTVGRTVLDANGLVALGVQGPGSVLEVDEAVVRDTRPAAAAGRVVGYGIHASDGARLVLAHTAVQGSHVLGISVVEASAHIEASAVRATRSAAGDPVSGTGVLVAEGAQASLVGALLQANGTGLLAADAGTRVELTAGVVQRQVAATADGGDGVFVENGADLQMRGSYVAHNARVGVVFNAASGMLAASRIAANLIGVTTMGESQLGTDVRVGDDVVVIDNTSANFDSRAISLPDVDRLRERIAPPPPPPPPPPAR